MHNPGWLISEITYTTGKPSKFRPVSVYTLVLEKDNSEYVALTDEVNSSLVEGLKFYLCSGDLINAFTEKYKELKVLFEAKAFKLVWAN